MPHVGERRSRKVLLVIAVLMLVTSIGWSGPAGAAQDDPATETPAQPESPPDPTVAPEPAASAPTQEPLARAPATPASR